MKKWGLRLLPGLFALMLLLAAPGAYALVNPELLYDQIEPLSYDLLVADNWHKAPPSLPYWQDTKKKTAALSGGEATDDGGTMATDAEMEACCIAVLPEDYFATLQSAGSAVMQYMVDANGATAGEAFQPYYPAESPIAGVHLGSDTVLSDNIPYENDVIPYATLDGEAREDGYGVVKPVDERQLIKDTYYNANIIGGSHAEDGGPVHRSVYEALRPKNDAA